MSFLMQGLEKDQTHHSHRFLRVPTPISCLHTDFCKRTLNFTSQETLRGQLLLPAEPVLGSKWLPTLQIHRSSAYGRAWMFP